MAAPATASSDRWLYGPVPDLLLGGGLWYVALLLVFALWGAEIRQGWGPILAPILMLVCGTPHHGATLVRVYENREDRRAYRLFSVWASLVVWGAFAVSVYDIPFGSLFLTVFLTWSPWHYTGQNYGLAVMFLRRRGIPLPNHVKRWLYATFGLSYAMVFLSQHSGGRAADYAVINNTWETYRFVSLGIPPSRLLFTLVASAYAASLVVTAVLLLRRGSPRDLLPTAVLVLAQGLWFSIPVLVRGFGVSLGMDPWEHAAEYYFLWIGVGHAVQYLWVTSYYAKRSPGWRGESPYLLKVLLAGALVWVLPGLIFAPKAFGNLPFATGLAALIAAGVNLQHFILDGAIWKLRSGRVAHVLIRRDITPAPIGDEGRHWLRPLVWTVGAVCVGVLAVATWENYFGIRVAMARGDLDRVERSLDRLAWIGRDDPDVHTRLAGLLLESRETERALRSYERAVALLPSSAKAWYGIGVIRAKQGRWDDAIEAYRASLGLETSARVLHGLGEAWLEKGDAKRATIALRRALALGDRDKDTARLLERAKRQRGEIQE